LQGSGPTAHHHVAGPLPIILLNRLQLRRSLSRLVPGLNLAAFSEQTPGVSARDRQPAKVVLDNRNRAAVEVGGPPFAWRQQVQLEHRQRDELLRWDHVVAGR
jgi:hypothetical protein